MPRIELGAIGFSAEFKNGQLVHGSPRIDILQDNMREVAAQVPDGKYEWVLILDLEKAHKPAAELTIQQVIDRGWIECQSKAACARILKVAKDGTVEKCPCGAFEYWNLFIQVGGPVTVVV